MSSNHLVNSIFSEFQKSLDDEQELRDVIRQICKEVDQISREITTVLQVVHHNEEGIAPACQQARQLFEKANEGYQRLKKAVPSTDFYKLLMPHINDLLKSGIYGYADNSTVVKIYMPGTRAREQVQTVREAMVQHLSDKLQAVSAWGNDTLVDFNVTKSRRYHDHWRFTTQRYCFLISLTIWLEKGILASHGTVAEILGVSAVEEKEGFHLDIEDYLVGLLHLCSELSRFAVNSVTRGDYEKPLQISKFVMELNAGFRLLNLKNDHLRKRFDALKYDVKKIEEVVYDLSIRGLLVKSEPTAES